MAVVLIDLKMTDLRIEHARRHHDVGDMGLI